MGFDDAVHEGVDLGFVGNVAAEPDAVYPVLAHLGGDPFAQVLAPAGYDDGCPKLTQRGGHGPSQMGPAPGDDGGAASQVEQLLCLHTRSPLPTGVASDGPG